MSSPLPRISRAELTDLLQRETAKLGDSELAWWRQHSVSPFIARYRDSVYGDLFCFIVAVSGSDVLFFEDTYSEFAHAKPEPVSETMRVCEVLGNLQEAITFVPIRRDATYTAASGNGAMALPLHAECSFCAVPEQRR